MSIFERPFYTGYTVSCNFVIPGFGSVGTFLEGPIIGVISTAYGWSGMFYFMIIVTFVGTAAVFRASVIKSRQVKVLPNEISLKESLLES